MIIRRLYALEGEKGGDVVLSDRSMDFVKVHCMCNLILRAYYDVESFLSGRIPSVRMKLTFPSTLRRQPSLAAHSFDMQTWDIR